MEAMEELAELADATQQGASLLADDDPSSADDRRARRGSSFLTAVAIGNVVRTLYPPLFRGRARRCVRTCAPESLIDRLPRVQFVQGSGKSAVLNGLIGHPVLVSTLCPDIFGHFFFAPPAFHACLVRRFLQILLHSRGCDVMCPEKNQDLPLP
jgi:glycine/D-amino acid oxidase-like deaminating enzyme